MTTQPSSKTLLEAAKALADKMPKGRHANHFHAYAEVVALREAIERATVEPKAECSRCRGSGEVKAMTQEHGPDDYEFDAECPDCKGVGVVDRATVPPAAKPVAQRQWIDGSDESNLGWWEYEEVDEATPLHKGYTPLYEQSSSTVSPPSADTQFVDFLQSWVEHAKSRGFKWDSFTFETHRPVREQLREQMAAGMNELQKSTTVTKGIE